ncbi:outer membrane protein assembly factor BamB family protein [Marinobacter gelidimuriae]|uniref:outer membrane protein assembly factor BamB family protein n=1 Tax=Marinobacter gelidimuriae TaxID=2739064 RepID=UPI000476A515|nr:PQQ-binding-like beta-propeller repeat protein [Marinobacter gelidimuriae]
MSPLFKLGTITLLLGVLAGCNASDGETGPAGEPGPTGPVISAISMTGAPTYPGGQIQILASAHSTNANTTLSYTWEVPAGWTGNATDEWLVLTAPEQQAEQATVTVQVSDGERQTRGSILVATRGPEIEAFDVSPLPLETEATFALDAFNRDGTVLRYHYDVGGRRFEDRGNEWTWDVPAIMPMSGIYRLQGIVEDTNGLTASASVDVTLPGVSEWPAFGGDRQRSGVRANGEKTFGSIQWDTGPIIEGVIFSSPALGSDGTVYVGSSDDKLYAINPNGGTEKWAFETDNWIISSPAVGADGTIYVGSFDKKLYAIKPDDGTEKWAFETGELIRSSPALAGQRCHLHRLK